MADFVVVGGVPIKVAPGGGKVDVSDAVDRRRAFDNTYRASATGGAARDWHFSTPAILRTLAASYRAVLSQVAAQMCSGEGLEIPTMCCAELIGETPVKGAASNYVTLDFALHESQSKRLLLKYAPGDSITGATFTRSTTAIYRDSSGNVGTAAIDTKRDAHYDVNDLTANSPSLLLEGAATNVALWNRDLTNAAWTKTTMTAAKDQTGADGGANTASSILATAGNATVTQAVTLASSARYQSAYVKRLIGSGTIQMTTDGGSTWTAVTVTAGWTRVTIPTQTLANPNLGFRIVTNGDKIAVDYVQNETGTFMTSAIPTTTLAVTRSPDLLSFPFTTPPQEMTVYLKFIERGTISTANGTPVLISNAGSASPYFGIYPPSNLYASIHTNSTTVTSALAVAPVYNDTVELNARLFGDGSVDITQSINGAASTSSTQSALLALATAWSGLLLWPNAPSGGVHGFTAIKAIKVVAGARSLAEMRAA